MKSISQEKERERESKRERELECKQNRIIIQTLSKSNTHSQGNFGGKTPVTTGTTITAVQGESTRRDVKGCKGTYSSGFSLVFTSIEAKRDETRKGKMCWQTWKTYAGRGLSHISCSVPVNGACLRLSFNVCVCVFAADKISKNCRRLFNQPPEEGRDRGRGRGSISIRRI